MRAVPLRGLFRTVAKSPPPLAQRSSAELPFGRASIETTIFPYNSNDYANQADELIRHFYVRPPDAEARHLWRCGRG
jgi:hypothetical protein